MHPFLDLRGQVARQLTDLSAPGAPLHRDSDQSTARLYRRGDIGRARFQKDTIDWYLSQANPRLGGRTAIVTAGPPGAGKSALLKTRIADLDEYRVIDADIIKDHLIRQAIADGIYDHLLAMAPLADGHGLAPRELSALVHVESVRLAEAIRETCTSLKENVVIEGTITWYLQGPNIFRELADNDYFDVEVYGIDIEQGKPTKAPSTVGGTCVSNGPRDKTDSGAGSPQLTRSTSATRPPAPNPFAPPTPRTSSTPRSRPGRFRACT